MSQDDLIQNHSHGGKVMELIDALMRVNVFDLTEQKVAAREDSVESLSLGPSLVRHPILYIKL